MTPPEGCRPRRMMASRARNDREEPREPHLDRVKPVHREGYRFIAGFAAATLVLFLVYRPARRRRPRADGLVLLLLPRPAAGDADPRGARRQPGRRRGLDDRAGNAAGRARARAGAAHPGQRVHERLRLPREPDARPAAGSPASPIVRASSSTPRSTRPARTTSATGSASSSPTGGRSRWCRSPGWWPGVSSASSPRATLRTGERFGLIRFGSRLDVYLPDGVAPLVAVGQAAVAGETVIADLASAEPRAPARAADDGRRRPRRPLRSSSWCRTSSPSSASAPG